MDTAGWVAKGDGGEIVLTILQLIDAVSRYRISTSGFIAVSFELMNSSSHCETVEAVQNLPANSQG